MIAVIQRVSEASVIVNGAVVGEIGHGFVVLLGVAKGDGDKEIKYLCEKIANLRVFDNEEGKFGKSLLDIGGAALIVSQFTLLGNWRKGRRPGYEAAAPPEEAEPLVEKFTEVLGSLGIPVQSGRFGASMKVSLVNEGPVTFVLDTSALP